jgi:hypothetical protein
MFVEDAKLRGAYVYRTIDDNPMLSEASRDEFNRALGGKGHPNCQRENYNIRVRDPEGSVVPEFSVLRHVTMPVVPRYAHCYVGADPGTRDKFGLVFGYWDFEREKLVIQRSWAERNASLADVARVIRETEQELWGAVGGAYDGERQRIARSEAAAADSAPEPLQFWDGAKLCANPHRRVSDTDARVIFELRDAHGIPFNAADKRHAKATQDAGSSRKLPEHKLASLRDWLLNDRVEIVPNSGPLQHQLNAGRWNLQRTDFERTDAHGHLDCVMALVYLLPQIERNANPNKPDIIGTEDNVFAMPGHGKPKTRTVEQLNNLFGKQKPRTRFGR